jgi:branched-chain amino acid transport system permease protein
MTNRTFIAVALAIAVAVIAASRLVSNDYFFSAAYTVLQFIILATAWNVLGGYTGYVNFGSAAFFAVGAYTTVFFHKAFPLPLPVMIVAGTLVAGLLGLGVGYLTLRMRGVFFAIATLALSVVLYTFVVNWDYVGGARGAYIILPREVPFGLPRYIHLLYAAMVLMTALALVIARAIETSFIGRGLAAIRDDEVAAECSGVPTLRLKLFSATVSGAMMGMAGTMLPYYISYIEPSAAFNLSYAVNSIAMPLIGGMTSWLGPLIGAVLLGSVQQIVQVTVSSAWNLLIVGVLLVAFVTLAPNGIMGWVDAWRIRLRHRNEGQSRLGDRKPERTLP